MTSPAEELRTAAATMREKWHGPASAPTAGLLERAAGELDMCEQMNSRDPHNDGATRVLPHPLASDAVLIARAINKDHP